MEIAPRPLGEGRGVRDKSVTQNQFLVLVVIALIAAVLIMFLVPRQKRALPFEIVLWLAAWLVAAMGAWLALAVVESLDAFAPLAIGILADIPVLPLILGALSGALILVIPLWLMDRSAAAEMERNGEEE